MSLVNRDELYEVLLEFTSTLVVLDWPENHTSHIFSKIDPPSDHENTNETEGTWYRCELCGCRKFVITARLSNERPREDLIWKTVPHKLTPRCPEVISKIL